MTIGYILLALIVLLLLITVHEFGHYIAGKILGFKINEFSIGFGPAIYKKTKKDGEIFSIRILPLGGYCAFEGEDETEEAKPDSFNSKPAWKRLIDLLAGVTFNFLFGILTAAIYLFVNGYALNKVTNVVSRDGLNTSSLQKEDIIMKVDGKNVEAYRSFSDMLSKYSKSEEFTITVDRNGEMIDISARKQEIPSFYFVSNPQKLTGKLFDENGTAISVEDFSDQIIAQLTTGETKELDNIGKGFALKTYLSNVYKTAEDATSKTNSYAEDANLKQLLDEQTISYASSSVGLGIIQSAVQAKYGFFETILKAWPFAFYLCGMIWTSLVGLFAGTVAVKETGGTITAISQIAEISQMGVNYFLLLLPLLSMNLALFNALPFPALDGARAVFVLIELIFKKPVPRKIEGLIHTIGLFLLLGLVLLLDFNHFFLSSFLLLS